MAEYLPSAWKLSCILHVIQRGYKISNYLLKFDWALWALECQEKAPWLNDAINQEWSGVLHRAVRHVQPILMHNLTHLPACIKWNSSGWRCRLLLLVTVIAGLPRQSTFPLRDGVIQWQSWGYSGKCTLRTLQKAVPYSSVLTNQDLPVLRQWIWFQKEVVNYFALLASHFFLVYANECLSGCHCLRSNIKHENLFSYKAVI